MLQLLNLCESNVDILAVEWFPQSGEVPQCLCFSFKVLHFNRIVLVHVGVNEDTLERLLDVELLNQILVVLFAPEVSGDGRMTLQSSFFMIGLEAPEGSLEYSIVPEVIAEHLLKQADHGDEAVSSPVVSLLEHDDECVDPLDLILENINQFLYRLLLLHQSKQKNMSLNIEI